MDDFDDPDSKIFDSKKIVAGILASIDAAKSKNAVGNTLEKSSIGNSSIEKSMNVLGAWKEVLFSINPEDNGKLLYYHSKLIDIKNGALIIETDNSGFIQLFHLHKAYILNGFKKKFPEQKIKKLICKIEKHID